MSTRTAAQLRAESKTEHEARRGECRMFALSDLIGDKWLSEILFVLAADDRRYAELSRLLPAISPKVLTQTLRDMERDGLISRTATLDTLVRVDYSITELGRSLIPVFIELKEWANAHIPAIAAARQHYDHTH
jgi:DNA-binding HxlR family transcriptional regulator